MKTGIIVHLSAYLYGNNLTEITDELFMGWAVGILEETAGYLKVITHYGYVGYLKRQTVVFQTKEELKRRDEKGKTAFIQRGFADVMEVPDVKGRILFTLGRGSFVKVLSEKKNGYQKVETADKTTGYVPIVALSRRRDNDGFLYTENPSGFFLRQKYLWRGCEEEIRKFLLTYAKSYLGVQYRWGGKSASGLDCSGMTFMSYQMSGILIYRDAAIKREYPIRQIPLEQKKAGDLLFFPGHVAMYLGNQKYIHCTGNERSFGCVINSLSEKDDDYREDLAKQIIAVGSAF